MVRIHSHWSDNQHFRILDPTASYGEKLAITKLDLTMFNVIGYDMVVDLPEPGSISLFLLGIAGLAGMRRRSH